MRKISGLKGSELKRQLKEKQQADELKSELKGCLRFLILFVITIALFFLVMKGFGEKKASVIKKITGKEVTWHEALLY